MAWDKTAATQINIKLPMLTHEPATNLSRLKQPRQDESREVNCPIVVKTKKRYLTCSVEKLIDK